MKLFAMLLAALLSLPALAADNSNVEFERKVEGHIKIAADGSVLDYDLEGSLLPQLSAPLRQSIEGWRFEPIEVDGRPVIAEASMSIELSLVPIDDDLLGLRIRRVSFGSPESGRDVVPPNYPRSALRAWVTGRVVLVLKLDDAGAVARVHVERVDLGGSSQLEASKPHWRKIFAESATQAAWRWRFEPGIEVDGKTRGSSVRVPVAYKIGSREHWGGYEPGPYVAAPWVKEAQDGLDERIAQLEEGETQPLDSPFRLLGDVIGSVL